MNQKIVGCFLLVFISFTLFSFAIQDIEHPKTKWRFKTQGSVRGTAVISGNVVYFGSSDGYIYALNKQNGNLIWKYKTDGAIVSSPEISNTSLYISSRDRNLYAINIKDGSLNWKFKMGENLLDNHAGWKYFMASPKVEGNNVLIGSGDGNLYAINITSGKLNWKFKTNGRIRATPLVHKNKIYQPSNDGYVYVLNLNGTLDWKFATKGTTYNPVDYTFDRSSIIAQPLIKNDLLIIASRDGNTYGVDLKTQKKKWDFTYGNTWAMGTNISDNIVYVNWSTNDTFCALDLKTGEEKWKFKTGSHNFPRALLSNTSVYMASSDGKIYRLNKLTGEKVWDYTIGDEIYASPIYDTETKSIFFGCDNGYLYAINEGTKVYKAVYHPYNTNTGKLKNPKASKEITPYLSKKGFRHIDNENDLYQFIKNRIEDKAVSVIVFPYLVIPHNVLGVHPEKGLMRHYLEKGGKVIWLGDIPNYFERNNLGKQIRSKIPASKLLDIEFGTPEFGIYFSKTTQEGQNWGLPKWLKTYSTSVSSRGIIPLAYNEFNQVSIWMKKFHPRDGSGYISCRTWGANTKIKETDLDLLYKIAIYGLE
ncbi:PQQ-binding-like beta-propeller repeat protein [Flavivirga aquimarina]|uniref:PQQ-binding-like beta-propeller repeat protein n=1 Tax=Flavivirga aquimarina TaxID=2027862 RepID=A0ABT8WHC9_9FLAO|nr:PQQ-binding-like beta-propeller repeat protein [Flavivirga aquimarina]MDO5972526.1 PQQ-binding-like beta-propeller repeat protein [Flavivirga aquimarina]